MANIFSAEFWTGRSDLYNDTSKVDSAKENLTRIKSNEIETGRIALQSAIRSLNDIHGFQKYVGSVNNATFDPCFEAATEAVDAVIEQIDSKVALIEEYNKSSGLEKFGGTLAMVGAKFGEGILSVGEGLLDGAATIVGWTGLVDTSEFIKKDLSHDAFNFVYNSDLAKASFFTENSALASISRGAGAVTGYLALGGTVSGVGAAWAAKTAGATTKLGKVAHAAGTFLSSSTKANTVIAAAGGLGEGTESGLQAGLDFGQASKQGVKQAAVQGATAFAVGKLGEYVQKTKAVKPAEDNLNSAKTARDAAKATRDAAKTKWENTIKDPNSSELAKKQAEYQLKSATKDWVSASKDVSSATKNLNAVQKTKLNTYQGYTDAISNSTRAHGQKLVENGIKSTLKADASAAFGTAKSGVQNAGNVLKSVKDKIGTTVTDARINVADFGLKEGTKLNLKHASKAIKGASSSATSTIKAIPGNVAGAIKNIPNQAPGALNKLGEITGTSGATLTGKTAIATAGRVAIPIAANRSIANNATAATQFRSRINAEEVINNSLAKNPISPSVNTPETVPTSTSIGDSGGGSSKLPPKEPTPATPTSGESSGGASIPSSNSGVNVSAQTTFNPKQQPSNEKLSGSATVGNKSTLSVSTKPITSSLLDPSSTVPNTPAPVAPAPPSNPSISTPPTPSPSEPTQSMPAETPSTPSNPTINIGTGTNHNNSTIPHSPSYNRNYYNNETLNTQPSVTEPASVIEELTEEPENLTTSIATGTKGNSYVKIPTSSTPITQSSSGSSAIPIAAGLATTAAVGIGAKAYMSRKENSDNGDEDDFKFDDETNSGDENGIKAENWQGDDILELENDELEEDNNYLDSSNDYGYETEFEPVEKYDARTSEELANLQ